MYAGTACFSPALPVVDEVSPRRGRRDRRLYIGDDGKRRLVILVSYRKRGVSTRRLRLNSFRRDVHPFRSHALAVIVSVSVAGSRKRRHHPWIRSRHQRMHCAFQERTYSCTERMTCDCNSCASFSHCSISVYSLVTPWKASGRSGKSLVA